MTPRTKPVTELPDQYLTLRQVAEVLQKPEKTVRDWRLKGEGPPFFKVGQQLRCDPADLRAYIAAQKKAS